MAAANATATADADAGNALVTLDAARDDHFLEFTEQARMSSASCKHIQIHNININ